MKTAKLGALFLISIMALAGIGAGYAAWTDTITIKGIVNTGTVDIVIEGLSGTEVFKDLDDESCDIYYWMTDEEGTLIHDYWMQGSPPTTPYLVAWANATLTVDDVTGETVEDSVTFTFANLFPSICFMADAKLHYVGSIPAIIDDVDIDVTDGADWINPLIASGDIEAVIYEWDPVDHVFGNEVCEGYQIHQCEWLVVVLIIHIPQDDNLPADFPLDTAMDLKGEATCTINLIQWNEY